MRLFACLAVLCASTMAAPPACADEPVGFVEVDENAERRARAADLLAHHRYNDALDVYRAAYAAHRSPALLYLIGCTAQVAGRARLAEHYLRKYLADAPDAPPARRADAARRLDALHALIEEGTAQWTPGNIERAAREREARQAAREEMAREEEGRIKEMVRDMEREAKLRKDPGGEAMSAGIIVMVVGHAVSTIGVIFSGVSGGYEREPRPLTAGVMLVPVMGPFLSMASAGDDNVLWSCFAILPASLQGFGFTLLMLGGVEAAHAADQVLPLADLRLVPYPTAGGGGLGITGSFW